MGATFYEFDCDQVEINKEKPTTVDSKNIWEKRVGRYNYQNIFKQNLINSDLPGFIAALHYAFQDHHPISIKPDDLYLLIIQVFAEEINQNAELYRDDIVSHEGKKEIKIFRDNFGPLGTLSNDWAGCIPEFMEKINLLISSKANQAINEQNFTTTTPNYELANIVSVMYAFKEYFSYTVATRCGIPKWRLEGTVNDWDLLILRVEKLFTLFKRDQTRDWCLEIIGVLKKFNSARKGEVDTSFFSSFYKYNSAHGSGSDSISGHVNLFFPFIYNSRSKIPTFNGKNNGNRIASNYPSGIITVPFKWDYLGTNIEMQFYSGFIGATVSDDGYITPVIEFAVSDKKDEKEKGDDFYNPLYNYTSKITEKKSINTVPKIGLFNKTPKKYYN